MTTPASIAAESGLYDPAMEHDACGVGFVAHIRGHKSHSIVEQGLLILKNLDHRGAVGADPLMGDGAGLLIQIPDAVFREDLAALGVALPPVGEYGVGMVFLPKEHASRMACEQELERAVRASGQVLLGLARRADRQRHADVAHRARERAGDPAAVRRSWARGDGHRRARTQALHHPQERGPCDPGAQAQARQGVLRPVDVRAHGGLQGAAPRGPGRRLLQGPLRSEDGVRDRARPSALLDEHVPELGARASLPHGRAQRRDQHGQGQRQLDQRAPAGDLVAGPRQATSTRSGR